MPNITDKTYAQSIADWRAGLNESIRRKNGWLALAGLFWLEPGKSRVGSNPDCEVQLPERLPPIIGYLECDGNVVTLWADAGQKVRVNGELVDSAVLQPDVADVPSFVTFEDVRFVIIQRGQRVGVRLWDNQREERKNFPARSWFEVDERFRVSAVYTAYDHPKEVPFPGVTGEKSDFPVEGCLSFEFNGKSYQLDVNEEDDDTLFARFWDQTAKDETYPTGRYLTVEKEGRDFLIDFNKAYNPPCAVTSFATCVFAPEQNRLDFRVTAGEKYTRH